MGKRHFNNSWLEKTDSNGHAKKDDNTATCILCQKDINIAYMGFGALNQHEEKQRHKGFAGHLSKSKTEEKTKTDVHVKEAKQTEEKSTQRVTQDFFMKKIDKPLHNLDLLQDTEAEPGQTVATGLNMWSIKQMAARAEIIAALNFAAQNLSFSSSQNLSTLYQQQFPDSVIARNVKIGPSKMSYMASYGLGSYFRQMIIKDIVEGNSFFTLHFDEMISAQTKKHMDLLVRYWSEKEHVVKVKYITSIMFGHAKADTVVDDMLQTLEELALPLRLMLSLDMDGPNVKQSVLNKLNKIKT